MQDAIVEQFELTIKPIDTSKSIKYDMVIVNIFQSIIAIAEVTTLGGSSEVSIKEFVNYLKVNMPTIEDNYEVKLYF